MERTTLQVDRAILKELKARTRKGETYNETLRRLLDLEGKRAHLQKLVDLAKDKKKLLSESDIKWD